MAISPSSMRWNVLFLWKNPAQTPCSAQSMARGCSGVKIMKLPPVLRGGVAWRDAPTPARTLTDYNQEPAQKDLARVETPQISVGQAQSGRFGVGRRKGST